MKPKDEDCNMYGYTNCPECNSVYRCSFNNNPDMIECDNCQFEEPHAEHNSIFWKEL